MVRISREVATQLKVIAMRQGKSIRETVDSIVSEKYQSLLSEEETTNDIAV